MNMSTQSHTKTTDRQDAGATHTHPTAKIARLCSAGSGRRRPHPPATRRRHDDADDKNSTTRHRPSASFAPLGRRAAHPLTDRCACPTCERASSGCCCGNDCARTRVCVCVCVCVCGQSIDCCWVRFEFSGERECTARTCGWPASRAGRIRERA
jgi:hypothetical protein